MTGLQSWYLACVGLHMSVRACVCVCVCMCVRVRVCVCVQEAGIHLVSGNSWRAHLKQARGRCGEPGWANPDWREHLAQGRHTDGQGGLVRGRGAQGGECELTGMVQCHVTAQESRPGTYSTAKLPTPPCHRGCTVGDEAGMFLVQNVFIKTPLSAMFFLFFLFLFCLCVLVAVGRF